MSTLLSLFAVLPPAVVIGWLTSNAIPYLSALATEAPSWATGMITLLLSTATGILSTWAAQGDQFQWRAAFGAALVSWLIAALHHFKLLSGTDLESDLHQFPKPRLVETPAAPANVPPPAA